MKPTGADWAVYVDEFHAARPGITEEVLAAAVCGGVDPYHWALAALPAAGRLLDLGCGTAPMARRPGLVGWIGADRSAAELAVARRHGARRLVAADAICLPFPAATFDGVACTMMLQIAPLLDATLSEIRRVLRPGGTLVAVLPARRPLTVSDRWRYLHLSAGLRRRIGYPNDSGLAEPAQLFRRADLELVGDERRRFVYTIADAAVFVGSLYLPGVPELRLEQATRTVRRWTGRRVGIPLRRVVARAR